MNGQIPFEGDTFIPLEILRLKEVFNIKKVLETGSQYGATQKWFKDNFEDSVGCEINDEFYAICRDKELHVLPCNSLVAIRSMDFDLIYIDSHWAGLPCPLKKELLEIKKKKIQPVIIIHDFKVPNHPEMGFDSYDFDLEFSEIEQLLKNIYKNGFDYHYGSECNGANRGIIYIYPKA